MVRFEKLAYEQLVNSAVLNRGRKMTAPGNISNRIVIKTPRSMLSIFATMVSPDNSTVSSSHSLPDLLTNIKEIFIFRKVFILKILNS